MEKGVREDDAGSGRSTRKAQERGMLRAKRVREAESVDVGKGRGVSGEVC